MVDYVRHFTPHDNFGGGSATYVLWANMWLIISREFLFLFFCSTGISNSSSRLFDKLGRFVWVLWKVRRHNNIITNKLKFHWDQFPRNFPVANVKMLRGSRQLVTRKSGVSPACYEEVTRKLTTFRPSRHVKMVWRVANKSARKLRGNWPQWNLSYSVYAVHSCAFAVSGVRGIKQPSESEAVFFAVRSPERIEVLLLKLLTDMAFSNYTLRAAESVPTRSKPIIGTGRFLRGGGRKLCRAKEYGKRP